METQTILVTGAGGFIGSNVCLELQRQGHKVVALDISSQAAKKNLLEFEGRIIEADIRNFDWQKEKVDSIIHEGAITDTTIKDRELMLSVNTEAFKKIVEHAEKENINVVYASSVSVYGKGKTPMQEDQEKDILTYYAESKHEMDKFATTKFSVFEDKNLRLVGLRYSNVYGPRESYKGKMASIVYQLYLQMKVGERPKIFKYGEQARDQVYIKDVVNATLLALKAKKNGVYNVGSGQTTSFNKIVEELNKILRTNLKPEYIDNPYSHYQEKTLVDLSNAKEFLNYEPQWTAEKGIADYVTFLIRQGK